LNERSDLTPLAEQGVLWLNACLTVRAHNANSHSKHGWETFTAEVLRAIVKRGKGGDQKKKGVVFLLWGLPAQKTCKAIGIDEVSGLHLSQILNNRSFQTKHLVLK
jgi:uracil-DNA glycosylase